MMQDQNAETKAIVTGGAQGIGFAIANQLVVEGCKSIALIGRDKEKGAKAVAKLEAAGAQAIFISADISNEKSALSAVEQASKNFGVINALANADWCASIFGLLALHQVTSFSVSFRISFRAA